MMQTPFLADVVSSLYLPYRIRFAFLVFILVAESLWLSKALSKRWYEGRIWLTVVLSNLLTTFIGIVIYNKPFGLLSYLTIDHYKGDLQFEQPIETFIISFVITVAVELPFNAWLLRKHFNLQRVLMGSLLANILTYLVAAAIFLYYLWMHYPA